MAVIVTDMRMPKNCTECPFATEKCLATAELVEFDRRADNCPLKPMKDDRKSGTLSQEEMDHLLQALSEDDDTISSEIEEAERRFSERFKNYCVPKEVSPILTDEDAQSIRDSMCNVKTEYRQGDVVSRSVCEQIRWERDIAIDQLKVLGYELGEKPRSDEDCISRKYLLSLATRDGAYDYVSALEIAEAPSVNPRKTGYWIKIKPYPLQMHDYECSECGHETDDNTENYCSDCGCRMVEPHNDLVE